MATKKQLEEKRENERAAIRAAVMTELAQAIGSDKAVSMVALHRAVYGEYDDRINDTRPLRRVITELRDEGVPVCSGPDGYFLSAAGTELKSYCGRLRRRALGMLTREARLRKITVPQLLGEVQMDIREAV